MVYRIIMLGSEVLGRAGMTLLLMVPSMSLRIFITIQSCKLKTFKHT